MATLGHPSPAAYIKAEMDMHAVAGMAGEYAVFNLASGRPVTHEVFPDRRTARRIAERKTRDHLLILCVQPDGIPLREAEACLKYERVLVSTGHRTPDTDPEDDDLVAMPRMAQDRLRMLSQYKTGRPLYGPEVTYGNSPFLKKGR